ncbi:Uncharacterised protein [Vibrio cholerae]|nr:Uncharacterised protein [Vibrio cholerae]
MKSHSRPSEDRPNFSNAERHKEPLHQMACLGKSGWISNERYSGHNAGSREKNFAFTAK